MSIPHFNLTVCNIREFHVLIGGRWHSHIRHTRMCRFYNGSLFHKKPLNIGPIFFKDIPKHRSVFPKFPQFLGVCMVNIKKFCKIGLHFDKNPKICTFFCQSAPLKNGYRGFEARAAHPVQIKPEHGPLPGFRSWYISFGCCICFFS